MFLTSMLQSGSGLKSDSSPRLGLGVGLNGLGLSAV